MTKIEQRKLLIVLAFINRTFVNKTIKIVPLLIFMGQKEVLHLLPAKVDLVLIVAFDCFSLIHRIIQGEQEFLKALHYGRWWTQIHVMDVAKPNKRKT